MSTGQYDDHRAEPRPARSESASQSRLRTRLSTAVAAVFCIGVLWWTMQTVLTENHAAKSAIRGMGSWNASERVGAIEDLEIAGLGNGKIAIPPLIVALGDKDARVRAAAATALGPIGSDTFSSGSDQESVRAAIMALLGSLKDPEPSVRSAAANALMNLPVAGKAPVVDPRAVMAILVERLGDPDPQTRLAAIQIMAALGPWAEGDPPKELIAALDDQTVYIRSMAVVALGSFPRNLDSIIPSLLRMMGGDDEGAVRAACANTLDRISVPTNFTAAVVPELIVALGPPDRRTRAMACSMLGKLGPEARAAIPALVAMAREERGEALRPDRSNWSADTLAIEALGRIAPKTDSAGQVVAVLSGLVRTAPPDKKSVAIIALDGFGPAAESAVPDLIHVLPDGTDADAKRPDPFTVADALSRIAPGTKSAGEAIAALLGLLRAVSPRLRWAAAHALGAFGPAAESAVPDLIRMLVEATDADASGVDNPAASALGRIAPGTKSADRAVAALTDMLTSESRSTRLAGIRALRSFGTEAAAAIPHLRALAKEPDAKARPDERTALEDSWVRTSAQATLKSLREVVEHPK